MAEETYEEWQARLEREESEDATWADNTDFTPF